MKPEWVELQEKDYPQVKDIYDYYVENTTVTFATGKVLLAELKTTVLTGHPKYKSFIIKAGGHAKKSG